MPTYLTTIGLEIHLKLNSETKIFCRCKNQQNFDTQPNTHICPVCTGQPGALPLLSQEVVDKAILFGQALNAEIQPFSAFDRKNYFYPDLPMGFQITQFYHPIIKNGEVRYWINQYEEEKSVHIHEAHLESDTAKMIHENGKSLLDFNRAGTPLLEIVTDPDFTSAEEVVEYAKEIQRIARRNGLGDADLEKGQMRVDVNISLRKNVNDPLGTKVEMKNINTFGAIKRAIEGEYQRQKELLESWQPVAQETRRREDTKGYSFAMRSKENVVDYRYFPEPDMPILKIPEPYLERVEAIALPYEYIKKCKQDFGFHKEFINALLLDKSLFDFFFTKVEQGFDAKTVAKWIAWPILKSGISIADFLENFVELFDEFLLLEQEKKLVDNQLKIVFDELFQTRKSIADIIKEHGFDSEGVHTDELALIVKEVLNEHPAIVEQYKNGKETTLGFFVGQVMKKTAGKANPQGVQDELKKQLAIL